MGHHYLDRLIETAPFRMLMEALRGDDSVGGQFVGTIASQTLRATAAGLERAKSDAGVVHCLWLMVRLSQCTRDSDFKGMLVPARGMPDVTFATLAELPAVYTVYDLISDYGDAADRHFIGCRSHSDLAEMARSAGAESLSVLCDKATTGLFSGPFLDVRDAVREFGRGKGFANLTHEFFGRLVRRYLEYHLSRGLSEHVGHGRRFASIHEHNDFLRDLGEYARLSTSLIKPYSAQWFEKHQTLNNFNLTMATGFVVHAIEKITDGLSRAGGQRRG